MQLRRRLTVAATATVVVVLAAGQAAGARPRKLDLCTLLPRTTLEHRIHASLGAPHNLSDEPVAAGCHFPAKAIGGTDVGLYASTDVPRGITQSSGGSFFASLDSFGRVYGTPTRVDGVGTAAFTAFVPGHLAQGAVLAFDGAQRAVLIVLVGEKVTAANTVTHGKALAKLMLGKLL